MGVSSIRIRLGDKMLHRKSKVTISYEPVEREKLLGKKSNRHMTGN